MTLNQYEAYRADIHRGKAIQHEGRSAATVADLDWIAEAVYGLNVGGGNIAAKKEAAATGEVQSVAKATTTAPPKKPSRTRPKRKPPAPVMEGDKDILKMTAEELQALARSLDVPYENVPRGKLIDAIVAKKEAA